MKYNIYQIESHKVESINSDLTKKNVHLILNQNDKSDDTIAYLSKIMSAINLSIVNDCSIHYADYQNKNWFNLFLTQSGPSKCIFFGVDPALIGIWFQVPLYRYFTLLDNDFIFIDAPDTIKTNKEKKGLFWGELRSEEHTSELQSRENLVCRL